MERQKLKLEDIPLANEKIIQETARLCKVPESTVVEYMNFIGTYTADVIRSGTMETVKLQYFGKFRAKKKVVRYFAENKLNARENILYRAVKGLKLIMMPKQNTDEIV